MYMDNANDFLSTNNVKGGDRECQGVQNNNLNSLA